MKYPLFTISAPARIHFGLFSVGETSRRFGGMGVMVKAPRTSLQCRPATKLSVCGLQTDSVLDHVRSWFVAFGNQLTGIDSMDTIPLELELTSHPPRHSGLGSGTQLAFSVAHLLFHALELQIPPVPRIARAMGRGLRSAIGSFGFSNGGFLVDQGIVEPGVIAELDFRCDFPSDWQLVLLRPLLEAGLHGKLEHKAFETLKFNNASKRVILEKLCSDAVVPAIQQRDYTSLGNPLFEFNRLSGEYFSQYQCGCYHSELCEKIVKDVRACGVDAVGQSSWGPCMFVIASSDQHAKDLVSGLRASDPNLYSDRNMEITITSADCRGARVSGNEQAEVVRSEE